MDRLSEKAATVIEGRLGFEFEDRSLLEQALTHASCHRPEPGQPALSNERLEFLGDAALGGTIACHLQSAHPDWTQGDLTKVKGAAVSQATLSRVGRDLGLGEFLLLGKGEEESGGRERPSILANAVEALIGAVWVETIATNRSRYTAHAIAGRIFKPLLMTIARVRPDVSYETVLDQLGEEVEKALPPCRPVDESARDGDWLSAAEVRLGGRLRNRSLLKQALTHGSCCAEGASDSACSNGPLAFVGGASLNAMVATHLYFMRPDWTAADLTRLRVIAVSGATLSRIGRELGLGELLLMGSGEEQNGGRERPSILASAVKAVTAAVYLDGDPDPERITLRRCLLRLLRPSLAAIERDRHHIDPKTVLQELIQEAQGILPTYRLVAESGPDHDKTFVVAAYVGKQVIGMAEGTTKKQAEQQAAQQALANGAEGLVRSAARSQAG